jgi:hypothetical protein
MLTRQTDTIFTHNTILYECFPCLPTDVDSGALDSMYVVVRAQRSVGLVLDSNRGPRDGSRITVTIEIGFFNPERKY